MEAASLASFAADNAWPTSFREVARSPKIVSGNGKFAVGAVRPLGVARDCREFLHDLPVTARNLGELQIVIAVAFGDIQPHPHISVPLHDGCLSIAARVRVSSARFRCSIVALRSPMRARTPVRVDGRESCCARWKCGRASVQL